MNSASRRAFAAPSKLGLALLTAVACAASPPAAPVPAAPVPAAPDPPQPSSSAPAAATEPPPQAVASVEPPPAESPPAEPPPAEPAPIAEGEPCGTRTIQATKGECAEELYCVYWRDCGTDDNGGVCQQKPVMCADFYEPVCGCDHKTYGNSCKAAEAGVNIAKKGRCAP